MRIMKLKGWLKGVVKGQDYRERGICNDSGKQYGEVLSKQMLGR